MKRGLMEISGLTDCAVFSVVAGSGAVAFILVLSVPHAHTPVLTGEVAARVHCKKKNSCGKASASDCMRQKDHIYEGLVEEEAEEEIIQLHLG